MSDSLRKVSSTVISMEDCVNYFPQVTEADICIMGDATSNICKVGL